MKKFDCVVEPFINFTAQSDFASLSPAISFRISRQNFTLLGKSENGCYALAPVRLPVFSANRLCFTLHWRLLIWLRVCCDWLSYKNRFILVWRYPQEMSTKTHNFKNLVIFSALRLRWRAKGQMPTRRRCICTVVHGKLIYVIGGHDGSSILNTVEVYDTTR